jgi:hypothetical protein
MIVLGLLLILLAVGAAAVAASAPSATTRVIEMTAVGVTVKASPLAMFLAGAVSVLMLGFGFALVSRGTRRKTKARKELRGLRKDQATAADASAADESARRRHDESHDETEAGTTTNGSQDKRTPL